MAYSLASSGRKEYAVASGLTLVAAQVVADCARSTLRHAFLTKYVRNTLPGGIIELFSAP